MRYIRETAHRRQVTTSATVEYRISRLIFIVLRCSPLNIGSILVLDLHTQKFKHLQKQKLAYTGYSVGELMSLCLANMSIINVFTGLIV